MEVGLLKLSEFVIFYINVVDYCNVIIKGRYSYFVFIIDDGMLRDVGDYFFRQVMKVGKGLVFFQVGIGFVIKGVFFFCQVFLVINKRVYDFILLQGYFNIIL